jgi:hypothetical protein
LDTGDLHIFAGWVSMLFGAASGAVLGLRFYRESWAGGYASFRRRMLRLGHISFFGIGFLNLFFGMTVAVAGLPAGYAAISSAAFLVAVVTMPACCFLSAWKEPFRQLFPVPVLAVFAGVGATLLGWMST